MTPSHPPPTIPDHELVRCLAQGSYGDVWLARSLTSKVWRAVKVVHRARFPHAGPYEREYQGLLHYEPVSRENQHLTDILHIGRDESRDCFFCIMELADSMSGSAADSLEDPADYHPRTLEAELLSRGRLPFRETLDLGEALCRGLSFLHDHGLVHRDLKPSNILFIQGIPKLADVSLVAESDKPATLIGTEGYIPPEGTGTAPADVFALGKILYEAATGQDRLQFPELPGNLLPALNEPRFAEFNAILLQACDPQPSRRHASARALQTELNALLTETKPAKPSPFLVRKSLLAAFLTTAALAFASHHSVSSATETSPPMHLHATREFHLPDGWDQASLHLAEWNGDTEGELLILQDRELAVFSLEGQPLARWPCPPDAARPALAFTRDLDQDGRDEVLVHWRSEKQLTATVLNQHPVELRRFHAEGSLKDTPAGWQADSSLTPLFIASGQSAGDRRLFASCMTAYARSPRDLRCYDWETAELLWTLPVAPFITGHLETDLDSDGLSDLLAGSSAVSNGHELPDGTDDLHSYLYAVRHDGTLLWRKEFGGSYAHCRPHAFPTPEGTRRYLVVSTLGFEQAENTAQQEFGRFTILDPAGQAGPVFESDSEILSSHVADIHESPGLETVFTDRHGRVVILSNTLQPLAVRRFPAEPYASCLLIVDAVADLDGRPGPELLLRCSKVRQASAYSPGTPTSPPPVRFFHDNRILILTPGLEILADRLVAEQWKRYPNFRTIPANHGDDDTPDILLVADKVILFDLLPGKRPDPSGSPRSTVNLALSSTPPGSSLNPTGPSASPSFNGSLPPHVMELPAGQVLALALNGPSTDPMTRQPVGLHFDIFAARSTDSPFHRLEDGHPLASGQDRYFLQAQAVSDGWLYIFQVDTQGRVEWLFPSNPTSRFSSGTNPVQAGRPLRIPSGPDHPALYLDNVTGTEHLYAILSHQQWPELESALQTSANQSPEQTRGQTRIHIQEPLRIVYRGVGGIASSGPGTDSDGRQDPTGPGSYSHSSTGIVVIERWFRHVDP